MSDVIHSVALVIDNEADTYTRARQLVADSFDTVGELDSLDLRRTVADRIRAAEYRAGQALRDYTYELCGLGTDGEPTLMAREVITDALAGADWAALARHYSEDVYDVVEGYAEAAAILYGGDGHEEDTAEELWGQSRSTDWLIDSDVHDSIGEQLACTILEWHADELYSVARGDLERGDCGHVLSDPGPHGRPTGRDWCPSCGESVAVAGIPSVH